MNVNWRWHVRFRGLLPLAPNAVAEEGSVLVVRPDELEARKYQILRVNATGAACEAGSLIVERVRQLALTADAPVLIGVTDDDLYLFREGRKSRFLPDRRVTYLSVALARNGDFLADGHTDMLFAGQTLALADASGKLLWTKEMDAPIAVVGLSPEGRVVAAGLDTGRLAAFDAGRTLLWEAALEAPVAALALSAGGERCIAATADGIVVAIDHGEVAWRAEFPAASGESPGKITVACSARGTRAALVAGADAGGWVGLLDGEGRIGWEHSITAGPTGVALSPSGVYLALSQADGELLAFEIEPEGTAPTVGRLAPEEAVRRAQSDREAGRWEEARQGLLQALEGDPGCCDACQALIALDEEAVAVALTEAERLAGETRFAEALAALDAVRPLAPGDLELPRRWAAVVEAAERHTADAAGRSEAAGDGEAALQLWRSLLRLDPKRLRGREECARLGRLLADQWQQEGEAALAAGRDDEALALFRRAHDLAPCVALAARLRETEAQHCLKAGIALYNQQRFPEAAFQFRRALALQPDQPEALRYLAYISGTGPQSPLSERFSRLE